VPIRSVMPLPSPARCARTGSPRPAPVGRRRRRGQRRAVLDRTRQGAGHRHGRQIVLGLVHDLLSMMGSPYAKPIPDLRTPWIY
jgi:hypothetical protein